MSWLIGVLVLWGLLVSMGMSAARSGLESLAIIAIAWGPAALAIWFVVTRSKRRQARHLAMLAELGVAPGSGDDHIEDDSGIAINRSKRMIAMLADGAHRAYSYDQVRDWAIRHERAGRVVAGFGVANGMSAIGANARMEREARKNTGLFLTVKDLDHPTWRVAMKSQKTRERWMELLRQEINEGGLAGH